MSEARNNIKSSSYYASLVFDKDKKRKRENAIERCRTAVELFNAEVAEPFYKDPENAPYVFDPDKKKSWQELHGTYHEKIWIGTAVNSLGSSSSPFIEEYERLSREDLATFREQVPGWSITAYKDAPDDLGIVRGGICYYAGYKDPETRRNETLD